MALSHPGPRTGRGERRHCDPRPLGVRTLAAGGWGLPSRCLLGGGRALRKEAASSHRPGSAPAPAPAGTLTLVDGFESAREVAVLAITVHFTPEHRHRNPPLPPLAILAETRDDLLPRKRISEVAKRRRKQVVAKRFAVGSVFIPELASKTVVFTLVPRNLRR